MSCGNARRVVFWALLLIWGGKAHGQAFNVDVNLWTDVELGGGPPSDLYGAGSGQIGAWNPIGGGPGPFPLFDTAGNSTEVTLSHPRRGNGGAWNNSELSGDFRLLMADAEDMGEGQEYVLRGLQSGLYEVWTYCGSASESFSSETFVTVIGAIGEDEVRVAGTMPPNYFQLNRTHSVHRVDVMDGSIRIMARENWPDHRGYLTGFQLVPVPEPLTILTFSVGLAVFLRMRGRKL